MVEANNEAVIRKHLGHGHIAAAHAAAIEAFYEEYFNPYLNLHRPGRGAGGGGRGEGEDAADL